MTFPDFCITWLCGFATAIAIRWWNEGFRIRRKHRERAGRMLLPGDFK